MATKRRTRKTSTKAEEAAVEESVEAPAETPPVAAVAPVAPTEPDAPCVPIQTFVQISGRRAQGLAGYVRYVRDCMPGKKQSIADWRKDWEAFLRRPV